MEIRVDTREQTLKEKIANCKICQLDIGDIELVLNGETAVVIERKTVEDLASSIKDGRYAEQSLRLKSLTNVFIYYVIEGPIQKSNHGIPNSSIYSAMVSLSLYKGFNVFRTKDVDETAFWIENMAAKILKEGCVLKPLVTDYCSVVKKVKKDNICPGNFGQIILSQIPGVSSKIASCIMEQYQGSFKNLFSDPDKINVLTSLKVNDRKISKTVISSIILFLDTC
jgi:ERCC4-type nuclease